MPILFPRDKEKLVYLGYDRIAEFCKKNNVSIPLLEIRPPFQWLVNSCAYYRDGTIHMCLEQCQHPCGESMSRNWTWPGSSIDREPFGVICHEFGHHIDREVGDVKGKYWSEYSEWVMKESKEKELTNYAPNPAEWFAEMFRLFLTNHDLLAKLRPKTYALLTDRWKPVGPSDWLVGLGTNVPERVVLSQRRKMK